MSIVNRGEISASLIEEKANEFFKGLHNEGSCPPEYRISGLEYYELSRLFDYFRENGRYNVRAVKQVKVKGVLFKREKSTYELELTARTPKS